jgi:hypothetical protein
MTNTMTDAMTISAAANIEADRWARKGYRLTRFDGPVAMAAAEREAYARTGSPPARR